MRIKKAKLTMMNQITHSGLFRMTKWTMKIDIKINDKFLLKTMLSTSSLINHKPLDNYSIKWSIKNQEIMKLSLIQHKETSMI